MTREMHNRSMKGIIRQDDVVEVLREGPVHNLSELASKFANREDMTEYDWIILKNTVAKKIRALCKSGTIERVGIGERARWILKEEKEDGKKDE